MDMISMYVAEVGRNLPEKVRSDIEKELCSSLEDALEDKAREEGRQVDEEMMVSLLRTYGAPEKVAASYQAPKYLIGPGLYPTFWMVVRIVVVVFAVITAIGFGLSLRQLSVAPENLLTALLEALAGLWGGAMQALGTVVLVFAFLQWVLPKGIQKERAWDPRSLKAQPDPERAKPAELIAEIVFNVLAIILFAFYPEKVGIYFMTQPGGEWSFIPLLSNAFYSYIPWLVLGWVLDIIRSSVVLYRGRWTIITRWFSAGISLYTIALLTIMLTGPALIAIPPEALTSLPGMPITLANAILAGRGLNTAVQLLLALLIVLEGIDFVKTLYRLLWKRPALAID